MKESKFIELLNLYIDQQISPAEAALLEEEILRDPHRRRTYREYCRLHRACTLVFEDARVRAGTAEVDRRVELAPRRRLAWGYYAAGLAAAACLAFVVVEVRRSPAMVPLAAQPAGAVAAALRPAAAVVPLRLDATSPARLHFDSATFVADRLNLLTVERTPPSASLVIVNRPAQPVPLRPLTVRNAPASGRPTIEQFVFEQPETAPNAPQVFRVRQTDGTQEEMAAYQFQR